METNQVKANICDEQVFKSVFVSHFKKLRNFLVYKFGSIEKAEDVAQNAFVILWEHCKKVRSDKAKSFLFTTAIRMSLNSIKREKVALYYQSTQNKTQIHLESPEFILLETEFNVKLEKTINLLPENQREVFLMNRIDSLTYKEIAELLNISVKAVEKRMSAALVFLRKEIGNI